MYSSVEGMSKCEYECDKSAYMDPVRVLELVHVSSLFAERFPVSACSRGILSS